MTSSHYPFAGNPHAQADNNSIRYSQGDGRAHYGNAPYGDQAHGFHNGSYDYPAHSDGGANRHHDGAYPSGQYHDQFFDDEDGSRFDMSNVARDTNTASGRHGHSRSGGPYNEKSSPITPSASTGFGTGLTDFNAYGNRSGEKNNSIFTAEDRHVFFKRSVPVRAMRSICCILLWTVIIIINVVLLVILFARPPNVALLSVNPPKSSDFAVSGTSFKASGSINFAVSNPNSFSATIQHLQATLYDANLAQKVSVGNGTLKDQKIKANDNTTVVFPFDVGIDLSNGATELLADVASSCGISAGTSKRATNQLKVLLDVDARISVLSVGVSIPIQRNITIDCPTSSLQAVLNDFPGLSSSLQGVLSGNSKKRSDSEHSYDSRAEESLADPIARALQDISLEFGKREALGSLIQAWLPRGAGPTRSLSAMAGEERDL